MHLENLLDALDVVLGLPEMSLESELSPILGDGLKDQAAAIWD
jgi:hypothetical protein